MNKNDAQAVANMVGYYVNQIGGFDRMLPFQVKAIKSLMDETK